jgi:hypothetical protein
MDPNQVYDQKPEKAFIPRNKGSGCSVSECPMVCPKETDDLAEGNLYFYAQLMRHDWHGKVRGRVRQRGWGH